jgi:hypothetical protein
MRDLRRNDADVDLAKTEKLVVALLIAIAVGAGVYVGMWKLPPPNLARLDTRTKEVCMWQLPSKPNFSSHSVEDK